MLTMQSNIHHPSSLFGPGNCFVVVVVGPVDNSGNLGIPSIAHERDFVSLCLVLCALHRTPEAMYDISSCDDTWCIYRGILRSGGVYILAVDLGTAVEDLGAAHN